MLHHLNEYTATENDIMLDPYDEVWGKSLRSANGWLRDRALRDWVSGQNVDKGIAPANHHVWQQHMASSGSDASGALRPVKCARWKRRQRNQWIQRWAKRCRVQQGAFKDGARLSLETLQTKVCLLYTSDAADE